MTPPKVTRTRFAQLELRVLREDEHLPLDARELGPLFKRWGLSAQPQECIWVIAYDSNLTVRTIFETARGGHTAVDAHIPTMMAAVLTAGCERFIVGHNHPNGVLMPTQADFDFTSKINAAANALSLYFEDHLILVPQGWSWSFVDAGYLKPAPYVPAGRNEAAAMPASPPAPRPA
jgi:DNA repair protein RadC